MKLKDKFQMLYAYYDINRRVGHTRLMKEGTKHYENDFILIVPNLGMGKVLLQNDNDRPNVKCLTINSLNNLVGSNKPIIFDNSTLHELFKEAYETLNKFEEVKQKMFLEGFKASGEGYNGEHPPRTDEEIWKHIKEDYNKVK